ncbi:MAG: shikimate dehydrogenase family protein [bacterium]
MRTVESVGSPLWVIGKPIKHSLSPLIHNAALREARLPHRYFSLEVGEEELEEFLTIFKTIKCPGANLTLPLKQKILELVPREKQTETVRSLGAANTLYWSGSSPALENTDVYGFKKLAENWKELIEEFPVLVLGAGGAARACILALSELDCSEIFLWNRTTERAEQLKDEFSGIPVTVLYSEDFEKEAPEARLVVNATSLGLKNGDRSPYPRRMVRPEMVGVDLIYNRTTEFMLNFDKAGQAAAGGLKMLVFQAARAWKLWFDKEPDLEIMFETARDYLLKHQNR